MEMRKFIIEIHPDGTLTWCESEEPDDRYRTSNDRAWLAGFKQALIHFNEQVRTLEANKNTCLASQLMYQSAAKVRDAVESCYREYLKK